MRTRMAMAGLAIAHFLIAVIGVAIDARLGLVVVPALWATAAVIRAVMGLDENHDDNGGPGASA